jgi:hypothetical protein
MLWVPCDTARHLSPSIRYRTLQLLCGNNSLLTSKCDTLEALELADRLFDACPRLVKCFGKKAGMSLVLDRYGIAGHIPRWRAAPRLDLES